MKITTMSPMEPNEDGSPINAFRQDFSNNLGTNVGSNVTVMFSRFENEVHDFLIVIDRISGERIRIDR